MNTSSNVYLAKKTPTRMLRWGLSSGGWREAEGALRCHAKDPWQHSNNANEFQQAGYLGNPAGLHTLITRGGN